MKVFATNYFENVPTDEVESTNWTWNPVNMPNRPGRPTKSEVKTGVTNPDHHEDEDSPRASLYVA